MTLVREGWNWYVATFVVEFRVVSHPDQTVRLVADLQAHLIYATSKEEAYSKALSLGEPIGDSYHNANGDLITMTYRGIHDLDNLQTNTLEDGEHLTGFRINDISSEQIDALVTSREHLAIFEANRLSNPHNNPDLNDA